MADSAFAKPLSTRTKFWLALANIPLAVMGFYLPVPEALVEFEAASYIANWFFVAASLGVALYYAVRFRAERGAEPIPPLRERW